MRLQAVHILKEIQAVKTREQKMGLKVLMDFSQSLNTYHEKLLLLQVELAVTGRILIC
jgi:hypothetical protein